MRAEYSENCIIYKLPHTFLKKENAFEMGLYSDLPLAKCKDLLHSII